MDEIDNVEWLPKPNKMTTMVDDKLPISDASLYAGAWTFTFDEKNRVLMTRLKKRGWDLPGGKTEPDERQSSSDPSEMCISTAKRETYEETAVKIKNLKLIGWRLIHVGTPEPPNSKFPFPDCYFVYYYAEVEQLDEFIPEPQENGAVERAFVPFEEAIQLEKILMHKSLFEKAYHVSTNRTHSSS